MKITKEEFIKRARKVHGNKYDYSKVVYINCDTKVCIICPIHGEFWQTPYKHLNIKQGCPKCVGKNLTTEDVVKMFIKVHGNDYDYSNVVYEKMHKKVCIICPIHGEFWQTPDNHLHGHGCDKCAHDKLGLSKRQTLEYFIKKAKEIHGDDYDYSKSEYINATTKLCIICKKHGEFWQTPNKHLSGNGCPLCNRSKLETEMRLFLTENNIDFEEQKHFDWLGLQSIDYYLPKYKIAIECQGEQHFKPIDYFGGEDYYKITLQRDENKRKLCNENGINIVYYTNVKCVYPYKVFTNKKEILQMIQ